MCNSDDTCSNCKDGNNLTKCEHCDDSNCGSCGLWWPTEDDKGGCDGSCVKERELDANDHKRIDGAWERHKAARPININE